MTAMVAVAICGRDIARAVTASANPRDWVDSLWPNWSDPHEVALVLWAGLGCEALAFGLQMYGQRKTAASTAQVWPPLGMCQLEQCRCCHVDNLQHALVCGRW